MREEDPFIIRMNIAHYETMLKLDIDARKRSAVKRLLHDAEADLLEAEADVKQVMGFTTA